MELGYRGLQSGLHTAGRVQRFPRQILQQLKAAGRETESPESLPLRDPPLQNHPRSPADTNNLLGQLTKSNEGS